MKPNYSLFGNGESLLRAIPLNISYYCNLFELNPGEGGRLAGLAHDPFFPILTTRASALFEVDCKDSCDYLKYRQRITLHLSGIARKRFSPCSVPFAASVALMAMDVAETLQALQWEAESMSTEEDQCGRN